MSSRVRLQLGVICITDVTHGWGLRRFVARTAKCVLLRVLECRHQLHCHISNQVTETAMDTMIIYDRACHLFFTACSCAACKGPPALACHDGSPHAHGCSALIRQPHEQLPVAADALGEVLVHRERHLVDLFSGSP